jgi:hypothetical protein
VAVARKAEVAPIGARVVDSLPFSQGGNAAQAAALKAAGADGVALYLGVASPALVEACLAAGLGVFGVTLAGRFDGTAAVSQLMAWHMPMGTTHFLDVEGPSWVPPDPVEREKKAAELITKVKTWSAPISTAGFVPCMYVGVPQPLTSEELFALPVYRYWHGQGCVKDRSGKLAEPGCGWVAKQAWPSRTRGGVLVDDNQLEHDYRGRAIVWCAAA